MSTGFWMAYFLGALSVAVVVGFAVTYARMRRRYPIPGRRSSQRPNRFYWF